MILDIWMDYIPENTESTLKSITGVLESGLFMNYKVEVLGLTSLILVVSIPSRAPRRNVHYFSSYSVRP